MTSQPDMQGLDPKALEAASQSVIAEWKSICSELDCSPGDVARDFVSPANHRLLKAAITAYLASLPQQTAEPVIELPSQWPLGTRVKVPGDSRIGRVSDYGGDGWVHVDFPVGSWYGKIAEVTLWDDYRDVLGRVVREAWVRWAKQQPSPKPSWLVPYDQLSEPDKEVDRQIGEALAQYAHPARPAWGAVGLDAKLRSLATTLEAYGLDYMQAHHVIEKVRALASIPQQTAEPRKPLIDFKLPGQCNCNAFDDFYITDAGRAALATKENSNAE